MSIDNTNNTHGLLYITGIGPGDRSMRTFAAHDAITQADVIVGYKRYTDLISDLTINKQVIFSGMHDETERVNSAIDSVLCGHKVALISSGDPGVYGMAGLAFELCRQRKLTIPINVFPGITAANSAAAILGAPLSCDYCVLSLSDLLVPASRIIKRAEAAASGDFVTVIYNPASSERTEMIHEIRNIFLRRNNPQTPVGIVRNIYRKGQNVRITTLSDFTDFNLDMLTTVILGNSESFVYNDRLVNPRGYGL